MADMSVDEAIAYLKSEGFKAVVRKHGPKRRIDLSWPDDRRGAHLPEWRVIQIAEAWRDGSKAVRSEARHPAFRRS